MTLVFLFLLLLALACRVTSSSWLNLTQSLERQVRLDEKSIFQVCEIHHWRWWDCWLLGRERKIETVDTMMKLPRCFYEHTAMKCLTAFFVVSFNVVDVIVNATTIHDNDINNNNNNAIYRINVPLEEHGYTNLPSHIVIQHQTEWNDLLKTIERRFLQCNTKWTNNKSTNYFWLDES